MCLYQEEKQKVSSESRSVPADRWLWQVTPGLTEVPWGLSSPLCPRALAAELLSKDSSAIRRKIDPV
jgi:hypothetical protein